MLAGRGGLRPRGHVGLLRRWQLQLLTEQLWRDVHERLSAFVAQRVDDPADVADIVQDVFLRVHQHLGSVADESRMLPWLFQVTRNAIADHYRAPARRREVAMAEEGEAGDGSRLAFDAGAPVAATPDDEDALAELSRCVRPMVEQLPALYRDALTLVEFDGASQVEVAERLGVSVSGMKSRVQRGRSMLRDVLLECCEVSRSATGGVMDFAARPESGCGPACAPPPAPVQITRSRTGSRGRPPHSV